MSGDTPPEVPAARRANVLRRLSRRTNAKFEGIDREGVEERVGQLADETVVALAATLFAEPPVVTSAEARYLLGRGATDVELREYAAFCAEVADYWSPQNKWDLVRGLHCYDLPELLGVEDLSAAGEEVTELCRWLLRGPSRIRGAVVNPLRRGVLKRVADGRSAGGALVVADLQLLRLVCDRPDGTEEIELLVGTSPSAEAVLNAPRAR